MVDPSAKRRCGAAREAAARCATLGANLKRNPITSSATAARRLMKTWYAVFTQVYVRFCSFSKPEAADPAVGGAENTLYGANKKGRENGVKPRA